MLKFTRDVGFAREVLEHVDVADDVRRLRGDADRVREVAHHAQAAVRQRVLQLGLLVRVAGGADRDQLAPPGRTAEVAPQRLRPRSSSR